MRDVQRALVSTASLSKQSVYIPVALVGYLAANPNDVGYVKRILGQTVERRTRGVSNNKNTLMAMLIKCARLQPERLNATEAIRKKVLTIMAQKIRSDSGSKRPFRNSRRFRHSIRRAKRRDRFNSGNT